MVSTVFEGLSVGDLQAHKLGSFKNFLKWPGGGGGVAYFDHLELAAAGHALDLLFGSGPKPLKPKADLQGRSCLNYLGLSEN